jgi:undecaprenyl-diphosphatase
MRNRKTCFLIGATFIALFALLTLLIMTIDVQPVGQNGTDIGFAGFNVGFHKMTGVNMTLYTITDWLGLVPIFICMIFGGVGFIQLIKRKSLFKVDKDIIILGIYYIIVIMAYLIFEMIPINYRPIPIEGVMEASYPSSTTLLVLSVMPTLVEQAGRRLSDDLIKKLITIFAVLFSLFMVIGRLISGVHWFTDIIGSVLLSIGLYYLYKGCVLSCNKEA